MAEMNATAFKASCLEVMDRIAKTREEVVITKRGKAVARLVPVDPPKEIKLFGAMKGTFHIPDEELLTPGACADEWQVVKESEGK
ncbi:MAG: type II toxin-antitoxin system prevent-host-death family antitoxin [Silvanigrellales bacterium]|jgi:prevent-host-death family protein|nr:type II toxin-antitoxin system prevent-host-death family antitoxin [Silvanigrellales bacterium]